MGLHFEWDPETGRKLDASLLEAIMVSDAGLPLLEHLLSELYRMQLPRNDGVLRWSDYRELGELEAALADRAESAFLALDGDAQVALESVIRKLTSRGNGEEGVLIRQPVPYRDLVSASQLSKRQKAGAKRLISRFVQEGLFHTETDPNKEMLVSVPQESLLQNWPRVRRLLNAYLEFLRMRDRLEANVKLWQSRGRRSDHLLRSGSGFSEAEALLEGFRTSLSDTQLDYLHKSLKTHDRRHLLRSSAVLAGIAGVTVFASLAGLQWLNAKKERVKAQTADANFKLAERQRHALQTQLKETEIKAQQVQKNAELAASQRDALQSQLKNSEAKVELAQKNAELATSQRDAVLAQLKETEAKAEQAQKNADLATSERDALQSQLKTAEEQAERSASAQPLGSPEQPDH
jgi:hypothetical protein